MRYILFFIFLLVYSSSLAQKKSGMGALQGTAEVGPLCPHEPCNLSQARLKQIYNSLRVVIYDSQQKEIKKVNISTKAHFTTNLRPGIYFAEVKPTEGQAANPPELKQFKIEKGKTTKLKLEYDTGMR